jgi:hypothetical protein
MTVIPDHLRGALRYRPLDDGRCLVLYRMMPGQIRMTIGAQDAGTYDDFWCFHGLPNALETFTSWDGSGECPGRWYRHGSTARRRDYDENGELIREYVMR